MLIVSYDFLISIYGNIETYLALSPLKNIFFSIFIIFILYLFFKIISDIYKEISKINRIIILAFTVIFLLNAVYYEKIKHAKLYQNFFRKEWVARPMYENFKIIISNSLQYYQYIKEDSDTAEIKKSQVIQNIKSDFKNIIVIAIESFDLNYLHSENSLIPEECTRNIDNIKNKYAHFTNYFTSAQPTRYGLHSILTSRIDYHKDKKNIPGIFTVLNNHGWETYFISAVSGYYGNEGKYFAERYKPNHAFFSEYFEKKYMLKTKGWGVDSDILFQEALNIIKSDTQKYNFIFISTIDTHPPYGTVPGVDDDCMKNKTITKSKFLLSLCAIDRKLSKFVNNAIAVKDPTLVIITSDHSATHGENFTKRKNFDPDRIPLIFVSNSESGNLFKKQINTNYCSQIDVAPTILKFCSIEQPKSFLGKFILETNKSYSRLTSDTIIVREENTTKIIHNQDIVNLP